MQGTAAVGFSPPPASVRYGWIGRTLSAIHMRVTVGFQRINSRRECIRRKFQGTSVNCFARTRNIGQTPGSFRPAILQTPHPADRHPARLSGQETATTGCQGFVILSPRITQATLPGSRVVGFGVDASVNVTAITPPGRTPQGFAPISKTPIRTDPALFIGARSNAKAILKRPTPATRTAKSRRAGNNPLRSAYRCAAARGHFASCRRGA